MDGRFVQLIVKGIAGLQEADLVRRVADGDRAAFDELYRCTSPWLAARLHRRCADEDVVADVLQETCPAVWHAAAGPSPRRNHARSSTPSMAAGWWRAPTGWGYRSTPRD